MTSTFKIFNLIRLTALFKNAIGAPVDPTGITLRLLPPGGVLQTYVYGTDIQVIRESIGLYSFEFEPAVSGEFEYQWRGTGACIAMDETSFTIAPSSF